MQHRLSSSLQWTALPKELITQVKSIFRQNFKDSIGEGKIEVDGRIYPGEILLMVGYRAPKGLKQSNFEISMAYKREKDNVLKLLHLAVDAAASLFEQFFAAENDHDFPRIWESVPFEGRELFVQYTTTNTELEDQADRLLGLKGDEHLAEGNWDTAEETAEEIKARLGVDGENEEDEHVHGPDCDHDHDDDDHGGKAH